MARTKWFKYQAQLMQAMGTTYADIGRVRVIQCAAEDLDGGN